MRRVVTEAGLDLAQLHGHEGIEACAECGAPAFRVVHIPAMGQEEGNVPAEKLAKDVLDQLSPNFAAGVLLDATIRGALGEFVFFGAIVGVEQKVLGTILRGVQGGRVLLLATTVTRALGVCVVLDTIVGGVQGGLVLMDTAVKRARVVPVCRWYASRRDL